MIARKMEHVSESPEGNSRAAECEDRRKRSRMQVHWPLHFLSGNSTDIEKAVTRDLSSNGFYYIAKMPFVPGEVKMCILGVPTSYPRGDERMLWVECTIRIIRVQVCDGGSFGIGCRIVNYRFV
jgi:hypothetical protein